MGKLRGTARRFGRDEDGSIGIIFGLSAMTMFLLMGAAIDISRWLSARTDTLNAVDAAVLAGARALQMDSSNPAAAVETAKRYYEANTRNRIAVTDTIKFKTARNDTAFQATGTATLDTPFLGFAGVSSLPLVKVAAADSDSEFSEAVLKVGGNGEMNLEVSLMLDVTGSMYGSKLADLKVAAKDLIDIVVWEDQSEYTSRVALVPFSEAVRIDNDLKTALAIPGTGTITFKNKSNKNTTYKRDNNCVTERAGVDALLDTLPVALSQPKPFYDADGKCLPSAATVIPLSSDKTMLKSQIDGYVANGATAGQLGTAWAWYMLSPNWAPKLPAASAPASYSMLTELNSKGTQKLKKIAVLMTDGEYNEEYCQNGADSDVVKTCTLLNGNATNQAKLLCTAMKLKGIEVYTVGFALGGNNTALTMLQNCASGTANFYQADDGEQLKQAFRDIALKISDLYLTK